MQHPTQSPIDPADLPPEPMGEVPPIMVAVPSQARTVLRDAGLDLRVLDDALVQARLEDLANRIEAVADAMRSLLVALTAEREG